MCSDSYREDGTFLICSFWLVSSLMIVGEQQMARDLMERPLREASPLGLYAEEFDTATARHLGNFPRAFSPLVPVVAGPPALTSPLPRGTIRNAAGMQFHGNEEAQAVK